MKFRSPAVVVEQPARTIFGDLAWEEASMGRMRAVSIGGREHEVEIGGSEHEIEIGAKKLTNKASGNSKIYFFDTESNPRPHIGWLNFPSQKELEEDMIAYRGLKGTLRDILPTRYSEIPKPSNLTLTNQHKTILGYWVEDVHDVKTFKPGMCFNGLSPGVKRQFKDKAKALEGLQTVKDNFNTICQTVGELTLGIHAVTGKLFLLDVGPSSDGRVMSSGDGDSKDLASRGLDKLIEYVNSLPDQKPDETEKTG